MKRAALVLAVALAGCGGSKPQAPKKKEPRTEREARPVDKAIRDLDKTDLPDDMKRELREAKRLLDESG